MGCAHGCHRVAVLLHSEGKQSVCLCLCRCLALCLVGVLASLAYGFLCAVCVCVCGLCLHVSLTLSLTLSLTSYCACVSVAVFGTCACLWVTLHLSTTGLYVDWALGISKHTDVSPWLYLTNGPEVDFADLSSALGVSCRVQ